MRGVSHQTLWPWNIFLAVKDVINMLIYQKLKQDKKNFNNSLEPSHNKFNGLEAYSKQLKSVNR